MKWPWVSREALAAKHETIELLLEQLRVAESTIAGMTARAARDRDVAQGRIAVLTDQMLEMRKAGFEPPTPRVEMPEGLSLPTPVIDAIDQRATDPTVRRSLIDHAAAALRAGGKLEDVVTEILVGEDFTEMSL